MADLKFKSIDDYESYVRATIGTWPAEQRTLLAASMAERWFPLYEAFSKAEKWGDPKALRAALDAVWHHLQGRPLTPRESEAHAAQVHLATPHMDDFDDMAALAACIMVGEGLRCCLSPDNANHTIQAIISGFHAVEPEWDMDPEDEPTLWRRAAVRAELKKQVLLIELVGAGVSLDDATLKDFRKRLIGKELRGETPPAARETAAPGISNQVLFEQYRRMLEADLKSSDDWWQKLYEPGSSTWVLMVFSKWAARYSRRRQTIDGSYGAPADKVAQQALVARQRALDGAKSALPDWEPALRDRINMMLANPHVGYDVTSLEEAHAYSPSVRALWADAQQAGKSPVESWLHIYGWATRRPAAWEAEDKRKKKKLASSTPELDKLIVREVRWDRTGDVELAWSADVDGAHWQVRLNDFPDAFMYSLIIDRDEIGDFHDWPAAWSRD